MKIDITCFKAYDARGKVPSELNTDIAYRVGRAYAEHAVKYPNAIKGRVTNARWALSLNGFSDCDDFSLVALCGSLR